jgi:hypothetical protein
MTTFQKLLIAVLLIFALSFAYYLVVFIPSKEAKKLKIQASFFKLRNDCAKQAESTYVQDWNNACSDLGQADECRLPNAYVADLDKRLQKLKDDCREQYSFPQ